MPTIKPETLRAVREAARSKDHAFFAIFPDGYGPGRDIAYEYTHRKDSWARGTLDNVIATDTGNRFSHFVAHPAHSAESVRANVARVGGIIVGADECGRIA